MIFAADTLLAFINEGTLSIILIAIFFGVGLFFFFPRHTQPAPKKRSLTDIRVGDTIVLTPNSPSPGSWTVEKSHRYQEGTSVWLQHELVSDEQKMFLEVRPGAGSPEPHIFLSAPLNPENYDEVDELDLDRDAPPEEIFWRNKNYRRSVAKNLRFFRNGSEQGRDVFYLEYASENGATIVSFEFWSRGTPVTSEGLRLTPDAIEHSSS